MSGGRGTSAVIKVIGYIIYLEVIFTHGYARNITLTNTQSLITAEIGEELRITCLGTKCQNPEFNWAALSDNPIPGTFNNNGQISILTMKISSENLDSYDSFRCTVICDNPPAEKAFKIQVYSFPKPNLTISSRTAGEWSNITCTIPNAYPYYMFNVSITVGGKIVANIDDLWLDSDQHMVQNIILPHNLKLTDKYEAEELKCEATLRLEGEDDTVITRNTTTHLNLLYPPGEVEITVNTGTHVNAADNISLLCEYESRSPAKVTWMKIDNGKELVLSHDQKFLKISNAVPEDSGVYICTVQNDVGITSSQVQITVQALPEKPKLTIHPATIIQAGQPFTIECLPNGNQNVNITLWKKLKHGDTPLLGTNGKFVIKEAAPIDTAIYKCIAENNYGASESSQSLTVEYPPMETTFISSFEEVNEGGEVTLTCTSNAVPEPSFFLYHLLPSGDSILLSKGPEITLINVTSGVYQCEARNLLGSMKEKLEVKVRFPPKNTYVTITPSSVITEGETVQVRCTSEAYPTPSLVLKKQTETGLVELETENGQYSITNITEEHAGTYICVASNMVGQQEAKATITVQVPPKNTHITITPPEGVKEGDFIDIRCTSEASPAPRLALKLRTEHGVRELVSEGGQYQIAHAGMKHTGTYICESTNVAGQHIAETTLIVQVPPKNTVWIISPSPVLLEGESGQLRCTSEAFPAPRLVLKKETKAGLIELETENGVYSITEAGVEHSGTYICESTNEAGQQVAETTFIVQAPPKNTLISIVPSLVVKEGEDVQIQCISEAYPSPKLALLLKTEQDVITRLESDDGLYNITNVGEQNMGTYICESTNVVGQQTAEATLTVQVPPRNTPIVTPSQTITAGVTVTIIYDSRIPPPPERQQSSRFDYVPPAIIGSVVLVTAGFIGTIVYHLKQSKVQGSYSLVKALRSKI